MENKNLEKLVITSAQACAKPHSNFVKGLENYCENNNANLIILPMIGQSAKEDLDQINHFFKNYDIEEGNRKLNNNIEIQQFNIRPYQVDPITGLTRFAQRETTQIFASPKQRLRAIPHSLNKIPRFLATTGACTKPNYATSKDVSAERRRLGTIAKNDHTYGAIFVEIKNEEKYLLRNIRADSKGKFVDLGYKYENEEINKSELEALVIGDWHNGYTDEKVKFANYDMIDKLNPKKIILHDFFDGHSINHHKKGNLITQEIREGTQKNYHSLEKELEDAYLELCKISQHSKNGEIYIVASNHNEFLDRYLDEGRFIYDPINAKISFKLAYKLSEGKNPFKEGLKHFGKIPKNVRFLKREQDFKVRGYQLGAHGDKGYSGGVRSTRSKEDDYGRSISGHTHSAEILRDTYVVGTSTPLNLFYTKGSPTRWTNSNALLWDNATVQLIHIIDGNWR